MLDATTYGKPSWTDDADRVVEGEDALQETGFFGEDLVCVFYQTNQGFRGFIGRGDYQEGDYETTGMTLLGISRQGYPDEPIQYFDRETTMRLIGADMVFALEQHEMEAAE